MGNSCCNDRGDDQEVLKSTQKKEDMTPNKQENDKLTYSHNGGSPQNTNLLDSDIQNFDKEPNSYFNLNSEMLKSIDKHGFYQCYGGDSKLAYKKYEGSAPDGRPFKYFGQMDGNKMEGKGQLQFTEPSGEFVVCSFKNGRAEGDGAIYFANGDYFKGKLQDNSMREGTLLLSNGNKYEGKFIHNMYDGQGAFTFPDGRKYKGEYKQGQKHGQGTFNWSNGSSYTGAWKNGHQHGHGKFIDTKGEPHEGEFADGKMLKPKSK